eukprot:COSAG06_NODE_44705_length_361_cov_0.790076_1_plen_73_part_10
MFRLRSVGTVLSCVAKRARRGGGVGASSRGEEGTREVQHARGLYRAAAPLLIYEFLAPDHGKGQWDGVTASKK